MLTRSALAHSAAKVRRHLGKGADGLDALVPLVREGGTANLAEVLRKLYPREKDEPAQAKLRQLRLAIKRASEKAGVRLELAGDKKTRSSPDQREVWFEGDDLLMEATERWVAPNLVGPERIAQDAVELGPVRLYVVYSEKDARDAKKLLEALSPHLRSAGYELWSRADVLPGENLAAQKARESRRCRLTLHLVSPEFQAEGLDEDLTASVLPVLLHDVPHIPEGREIFRLTGRPFDKSKPRDFALELFRKIEEVLKRRQLTVTEDLRKLALHEAKFVEGPATSVSLEREIETHAATGRCDALTFLNDWLMDPQSPPYCALFGELGMGKTTTAKEFASGLWRRRREGELVPASVFLDLRYVGDYATQQPDLDEIVARVLKQNWKGGPASAPPAPQEIYQLVEQGGLVIFDGLDEVLVHLTPSQGQAFTRQLLRMAPPGAGRGRLLFTCRTHYFRTFKEQSAHFTTEDRDSVRAENHRALLLLPFGEEQIRAYLQHSLPNRDVNQTYEFIESVHNLPELAERPYTLSLIARQFTRLEEWKASGKMVTGLTLYRFVVDEWLLRDTGKHQLTPEHKQTLMENVAADLARAGWRAWSAADLEQWLMDFLDSNRKIASHYDGIKRDLLKEDLRTATFLVRDDKDRFRFAHTSLQEYFLSGYLKRTLELQQLENWALSGVSPETLDFLGQSLHEAPSGAAMKGLTALRDRYYQSASELAFRYVLLAQSRGYPTPAAAAFQLPGADLFALQVDHAGPGLLDLSNLNLAGANVANSFWRRCRLAEGNFSGADAARSEWQDCDLSRSQWLGTELEAGLFRRCDLANTDFAGARAYRMTRVLCSQEKLRPRYGVAVLQIGHSDQVNACAWSPDGCHLLSASSDKTLKIWDAASGHCLITLSGHSLPVTACAWSPDGRRVLSASADKTLRIWDVASGDCLLTFSERSFRMTACAWSPDGRRVVAASASRTLRVWDPVSGDCLLTLTGRSGPMTACAWSPDGCRVLSASADTNLSIWDAASGACLLTLSGHSRSVRGCAWSPDGRYVLSASADQTLRIWDAASGDCLLTLSGHSFRVTACAWSPDSRRVLSASADKTIRIWDAASGGCLLRLPLQSHWVSGCAWSPDGRRVLAASANSLSVVDAAVGRRLLTISGHSDPVNGCAWSPDGSCVLSASADKTLRIWDASSHRCLLKVPIQFRWVSGCAWSPDGRHVLSGCASATLRIWDAVSGDSVLTLSGHSVRVTACAWSPGGHRVLSASADRTLKIWDAESGRCLHTLLGHSSSVSGCAWSPDDRKVLSASADKAIRIWDASSGNCLLTLTGHSRSVNDCAFSPDGSRVVSASADGTLRIWDAVSGDCLLTLPGHRFRVTASVWSPDGSRVLSAGADKTLRVWDAASGNQVLMLEHNSEVTDCSWRSDGQVVASFTDGSIRLYACDAGTLVEIGPRFYHLNVPHGEPTWASIDIVNNRILGYGEDAWHSVGYTIPDEDGMPMWLPIEAFEPEPES